MAMAMAGCGGGDGGGNEASTRGALLEPPTLVASFTAAQIDAQAAASGSQALVGKARCDVNLYAVNYRTVGVEGEPTNASGVLLLPAGACKDGAPLLAYSKGTDVVKSRTLANAADAETRFLLAMYAAQGYALVASDMLGFAKSSYAFHPY
ncbi:MAG: esterase, partial [Comamonadaceae bacterium]